MAKSAGIGISFNRFSGQGRVVGDPEINGNWAKIMLKTIVPEQKNGAWEDVEVMVPIITNDAKRVKSIGDYVQDARQLYVEGFITSWSNAQGRLECAVMLTNYKLGSKTIYDPDADKGGSKGNEFPS